MCELASQIHDSKLVPGLVYTHPQPAGRLAGWLVARGHIFWPCRGQGTKVPCTLDSLAALAENGPLAAAHVLPRFSSITFMDEMGGEMIFLTWSASHGIPTTALLCTCWRDDLTG